MSCHRPGQEGEVSGVRSRVGVTFSYLMTTRYDGWAESVELVSHMAAAACAALSS